MWLYLQSKKDMSHLYVSDLLGFNIGNAGFKLFHLLRGKSYPELPGLMWKK